MRKNKLYVFLSILTIIFLFGTAAICTQCGANIDKAVGGLGDNIDEEPSGTEPGGEQPSGTEPGETPPGDEPPDGELPLDDEPPSGDEPPDEENNPPVIEVVIANGVTIEVGDEVITITRNSINFEVQASDPDDDELLYTATDNLGNIMEVIKIDNNHAQFGWVAPDTAGNYDVTIAASDEEEAADLRVIPVSVGHEEGGSGGYVQDDTTVVPDPALSGNMSESEIPSLASNSSGTPCIYVGDSADGSNIKGYLSFNVNGLSGKTIVEAEVVITSFAPTGDPTTLLGSDLDFYAVNYGDSLEGSDYRTGSYTHLASMTPESTSFAISGSELIEEIQEVLDDPGRDYFQIKLFFQNANGNGDPDGFVIYLSDVVLHITYYPA
jgi:hypothetical protein